MSKTFYRKSKTKSHVGASIIFVLLNFWVFLSDKSSKSQQKALKKIALKSFYKKIDQNNRKPIFSQLFYHVFGRFSATGVRKHHKKIDKKCLNLTYLPRGSPEIFLPAPWCTPLRPKK
jgi:hypothetical protein